ncbi:alpha/beta-hydrolase [Coprinopsis marcescibilis]|uniref:Alpha/beta-hydrolase n=1 Tax=Coprinopsis marcescibilis TaxID=230819 RepID=A0A5C3KL00_COPMA|nr:alpha/beta-hydrolase [Coprinopsis marcescibilis]
MSSLVNWFFRFQKFAVVLGGCYLGLVALLCVPYFQRHMLYLNAVKLPLFANFDSPESYGFAPNKTYNFKIHTPDHETIGAWFMLPESYYQSLPSIPVNVSEHITSALNARPTILFLHGNAATRAFHVRVAQYQALNSRLDANILVIDYRGFADSTGTPSEEGLVLDARAGWDWLVASGAKGEDVLVMGHSLGTGVGSQLAAQFGKEGIQSRGLVLLSPFASIGELLQHYHLFGFIPLIKPLYVIPGAARLVAWALVHKFDSLHSVKDIAGNVLIAHAQNDLEIPDSNSDILFQAFLDPYLPDAPVPTLGKLLSPEEWSSFSEAIDARNTKRTEIVMSTTIPKFGRVDEFTADGRRVVLVKTLVGSHDFVTSQEGLQDIIRKKFGF